KQCVSADSESHDGGMEMKSDRLEGSFAALQTASPGTNFSPQLVLVNGRNIFGVLFETGTSEGVLKMPPMPDVPATHKKIAQMFFHRLQFNDANKVSEEWAYEDMGTFMFQMGLMPKEAPPHRKAEHSKP